MTKDAIDVILKHAILPPEYGVRTLPTVNIVNKKL